MSEYTFIFYKGKILDPMEINITTDWTNTGGTLSESTAEFRNGSKCLLAVSCTNIVKTFDEEDLSDYDYLSLWVKPTVSTSGSINIENNGSYGTKVTFSNLTPNSWNFVQTDISSLTRDSVTEIKFEDIGTGSWYIDNLGFYDSTDSLQIKGKVNQLDESAAFNVSTIGGINRLGQQTKSTSGGLKQFRINVIIAEDLTNESEITTIYDMRKFFFKTKLNSDDKITKGNMYLLNSDIYKGYVRILEYGFTMTPPERTECRINMLECLDYV